MIPVKTSWPPASACGAGKVADAAEIDSAAVWVIVEITLCSTSTARTVAENGMPRTRADAMPNLPVGSPGRAVSPGRMICSLASASGTTGKVALPEANAAAAVTSVARGDGSAPRGSSVNVVAPRTSCSGAGAAVPGSSVESVTASVARVTWSKREDTARTVTVIGTPAVETDGTPDLPGATPGVNVSLAGARAGSA
ncbi:MAG: hypothetical protein M0D55_04930 [Elusimicrobiota bacterium]|nr:MAG: hypothetical protein M0D55_04930 [Elusimicrobiota bacterium]